MISKTIKFEDYNGDQVEDIFYFHLNKAELTKMNFDESGKTLTDMILEISEDVTGTRRVIDILEKICRASVGRKSEDGKRFIKNDAITSELFDTEAYSELFIELVQNPEKAAEFIQGMMPKETQKNMKNVLKGDDLTNLSREELVARINATNEVNQK